MVARFHHYIIGFFFCFNRHIHEKAILLVIIPSVLVSLRTKSRHEASLYLFLTNIGNVTLLPLLFGIEETFVKIFLTSSHLCLTMLLFSKVNGIRPNYGLNKAQVSFILTALVISHIAPLVLVIVFKQKLSFGDEIDCDPMHPPLIPYSFLPMMTYSFYLALANIQVYFKLYFNFLFG